MALLKEGLPDIICRSHYRERQKPHRWVLEQNVVVTLSDGSELAIPVNYVTDFASVPRLLWGIIIPVGRHNLAVLIHDFLYDTRDNRGRKFADQEMLHWLLRCGVSKIKSYTMYFAVRVGGRKWWNKPS